MAAASRERKKRIAGRSEIATNKSSTILPMFDRRFDPTQHNRYFKYKVEKERRREVMDELKAAMLEEDELRKEQWRVDDWRRRLKASLDRTKWSRLKADDPEKEAIEKAVAERLLNEQRLIERVSKVAKCFAGFIALSLFVAIGVFIGINFWLY